MTGHELISGEQKKEKTVIDHYGICWKKCKKKLINTHVLHSINWLMSSLGLKCFIRKTELSISTEADAHSKRCSGTELYFAYLLNRSTAVYFSH